MATTVVLSSGTDWTVTVAAPRLVLHAIKRHYGPVIALDGAELSVRVGEVHALLGENGAGKSTLTKIAFGLERPDSGTMLIDGAQVTFRSPRDAMLRGIGMVQQHFALVGAMTVTENVMLGAHGNFNARATQDQIRRISDESGLPIDPKALVSQLSVGAQQRLEIIKALARETRTLILDEPTAVLAPQEIDDLLSWTRRFANGGGTVVLIAHKLREVLSVADRVTVLRRGTTVLTADASSVTEAELAEAMLGAAAVAMPEIESTRIRAVYRAPVISLSNASASDEHGVLRLTSTNLTAYASEILGVAAVEGSGQRELLRIMSGRLRPTQGTVQLPAQVGFVPEDRHRDAVILDATITENVALRGAGERRGIMSWSALQQTTTELMRARDVRGDNVSAAMRTLSGGNQQKLVIGRELAMSPAALVVESPTRGLDIRATAEVHDALRRARDAGTAVVVYSTDLDEVLMLADRVIVVTAGQVREVTNERDAVGKEMLEAAT
jgi:general nucleoside transport system ATP-binding protein